MKTAKFLNLLCILLIPLVLDCSDASAEGAQIDAPIYVVDMQKVIDQSVTGKAARNNVEEEMKKKKLVLEKLKHDLDKAREEIDKQSSLLSPEALDNKKEGLLKKQRDFERAYSDQRDQLARKNHEAMSKVVKEIDEAIKKVAADKNYRLILEKDARTVAYVNEKYDISDEVIKTINAEKVGL